MAKRPHIKKWQRVQRFWHQGWGAETYGAALAAYSLAAIIAVVASFEGQTLPEWPMHITINALIAVFTVLLKAGLAILLTEGISQLKWQWFQKSPRLLMELDDFDNASRGPLGAVSFLFKTPQWEVVNNFAKFAALLTILAAAVDPFSQQIVSVVSCTRESDQSGASVGRTNGYYANDGYAGGTSSVIDSPMAVAINAGLVSPPNHIPSLVSTTCASGNCTFGQFSSVAVCHSCADISSQIQNFTVEFANYLLPASDNEQGFPILRMGHFVALNTSASISPRHLLDVRVVMSRGGPLDSAKTNPNAFQCQLFPCVRTYEASISRSVLEERILSEMPMGFDVFAGFEPFRKFDVFDGLGRYVIAATNLTRNSGKRVNCSPRPANDTAGLVFVAHVNVDAAPQEPRGDGSASPGAWYPEECVWTFDSGPYFAILPELRAYLDRASIPNYYPESPIGSIVAKNLWRNGAASFDTVDKFMRNLSDVMTATVRNNGQRGVEDYAMGTVNLETTCVAIRWAWLSFPAALVALGWAFLLMLVLQSPKDTPAIRSWKSSNIAVLFCSLDESIRQKTDLTWFRDEIDDVATTSRAQLVQDGAGKAKFIKEDM